MMFNSFLCKKLLHFRSLKLIRFKKTSLYFLFTVNQFQPAPYNQCDQIGQFFTLWAIIILPKSPTLLGNFCKGVKIIHFSIEIIFGQLLQTFGDFYLVTLLTILSIFICFCSLLCLFFCLYLYYSFHLSIYFIFISTFCFCFKSLCFSFKKRPSPASFSFIFDLSNKKYNFYNKYM